MRKHSQRGMPCSPESNRTPEAFVKTFELDYVFRAT